MDKRLDTEAIKAQRAPAETDCGDKDCPDCQGERYAAHAAIALDIVRAIAEAPEPRIVMDEGGSPHLTHEGDLWNVLIWWRAARALVGGDDAAT